MTPATAPTAPAISRRSLVLRLAAAPVGTEPLAVDEVTVTRLSPPRGTAPADGPRPLVLWVPGGAVSACAAPIDRVLTEGLVRLGAVVALLQLPPALRFPRNLTLVHAAALAVAKHRRSWAGAGAALFLAGSVAGATLAAGAAMMARDQGGPEIAGQLLVAPMLDPCLATASVRELPNEHGEMCWVAQAWRGLLACPQDALHPYAAPGQSVRLSRLPPALIVSAADNVLDDEAGAHARRLAEAGIPSRLVSLPSLDALGAGAACDAPPPPLPESLAVALRDFLQRPAPAG